MAEITLIKCKHCNFECKGLALHLKYKHNQTPADYRKQFPGAEIFSSSVRKQMSKNSAMAGSSQSFDEKFGIEKSAEIKKKIGIASGNTRTGLKKSERSKQKMRDTWNLKREEWANAIKINNQKPEYREKQRVVMKKRIAENGYHLARGRENKFEKFIRESIQALGYEVHKQKGFKSPSGSTRFFDLFIPELSLLVECDGEYWHRTAERIQIDKEKNEIAKVNNLKLLRISDKEFSRTNRNPMILHELLELSDQKLLERCNTLIFNREKIIIKS